MMQASNAVQNLVDLWKNELAHVQRLREQLAKAEVELQKAANAIGTVMDPGTLEEGEIVLTWAHLDRKRERLLEIKVVQSKVCYEVRWRGDARLSGDGSKADEQDDGIQTFEVWCEGFAATGQSGQATFYGKVKGKTFEEACQKMAVIQKWGSYDAERNTIWGCRLFDNEDDARKAFG